MHVKNRTRHESFEPRTAAREDRRQANEALGHSFCKTLSEPITNSDSSGKRKLGLPHSSGLADLMFEAKKGTLLDTSALRKQLLGTRPKRRIEVEVVTSKAHGRVGQVTIVDQAEGMSATTVKSALDEIGGDKLSLSGGVAGRNLFGRGLSDFLRAHSDGELWSFDGHELTHATGMWSNNGHWKIELDVIEAPTEKDFAKTPLYPSSTGTAVRCIIADRSKCHIPEDPNIVDRLRNFYMLRFIAADPNVELILRQCRSGNPQENCIEYDFPVGQIIECFSKQFVPPKGNISPDPFRIDFLLVRSDRKLRGLDTDRDARENGLLVVDDLDAVYDLTFADAEYERADFLRHIFGVVRVHGLRAVLQQHLNTAYTSPLRIDRDGFNVDNPFSAALLKFIGDSLRPYYDKERQLLEQQQQGAFSSETKKRIDEALKELNKYFQEVTGRSGDGTGGDPEPNPEALLEFRPAVIKLTVGRPRRVRVLLRADAVKEHAEVLTFASEGISVQPELHAIRKKEAMRFNEDYVVFWVEVSSDIVGHRGTVTALVDALEGGTIQAQLEIQDVLEEPEIIVPSTIEFRPAVSMGRPERRNNLVLVGNPSTVPMGHWIRVKITDRIGDVRLIDDAGVKSEEVDVKLESAHLVRGQKVFRVLVPWTGTAWNQRAKVEARVKVGPNTFIAISQIRLDEEKPNDGGFFKEVKYTELDTKSPSLLVQGVISVNSSDVLNQRIFGNTKAEFDKKLATDMVSQQRLATLLLEEASFRALEELMRENQLQLPAKREVSNIHERIDEYKFASALALFKALVR